MKVHVFQHERLLTSVVGNFVKWVLRPCNEVTWSRDSPVGIAAGYGLEGRGSIPDRGKRFSLHSVQTGSGAHPISYQMGVGIFPRE
jgi:hypothetical protein